MFLVALMILKKAKKKQKKKTKKQKTINKYEQDWNIRDFKSNPSFGLLSLLISLCNAGASGR